MSRNKNFIAITFEMCQLTELTPTEKLVFGRIASFEVYFETTAACAQLLGVAEGTVLKAKQKLEKLGFIKCVENDGRGKKYVTSEEWKTGKTKEVEAPKPRGNRSILRPSPTRQPKRNEWRKWEEQNKELVPVLDAATNYLSRHKIPLTDPKALRRGITAVANLYKDPNDNEAHVYLLQTYLEYLESEEYLYQLEHTKYCPNVATQYDLFGKFQAIRDFKNDERRHYDPAKTLTR